MERKPMLRFADEGCPMCGSNDEERLAIRLDGLDILEVDYKCKHCGAEYTMFFTLEYDAFQMGTVLWNNRGEVENDDYGYVDTNET